MYSINTLKLSGVLKSAVSMIFFFLNTWIQECLVYTKDDTRGTIVFSFIAFQITNENYAYTIRGSIKIYEDFCQSYFT